MAEHGIHELTIEQVSELCEGAEQAARSYILSKVSNSRISVLDVTVNAEGTKPLTVNVDVNVVLSPLLRDFNVDELTTEATKQAFVYIEEQLRELRCKSKK